MTRLLSVLTLALSALTFAACDKAEDLYAHSAAHLNYNLVATTPPLLSALTGAGQWCTITHAPASATSYTYSFANMDGTSYTSPALSQTTNGIPMSLAGFIVGTPSLMNLSGGFATVAYDRACPACYEKDLVQRALRFSGQTGHVHCDRCDRTYDLNNGGIVSSGAAGKKLFRYHISSSTTHLSITN